MSFNARDVSLQELWGRSENRYEVPRYQREYSWTKEEVESLWNDLNSEEDFFLGSVVMKEGGSTRSRIEIIDGQQRLITITILYAAIRDVTARIGDQASAARIHSNRIFEADDFGVGGQYILNPAPSLRDFFRRSIQQYPSPDFSRPSSKEEKRVKSNYDFFVKQINSRVEMVESQETKTELLYSLMNKIKSMKIIWITVTDEYDAYRIFETVNARGKDLSVADLLKNMIFKEIDVEDSGRDPAKEKWDDIKENLIPTSFDMAKFVRYHWISSRQKGVTMGKLYRSVKENTSSRAWAELLNQLRSDSKLLRELFTGDIPNPNNRPSISEINKSLISISEMGYSQCFILLLSLFRNRDRLSISWDELSKLTARLENFNFVYHKVCKLPANRVEKFYSDVAVNIHSIEISEDSEARLRGNLNSIYLKFNDERPNKDTFIKSFIENIKYVNSTAGKRLIRYILKSIDEYNHPRQQSEMTVNESISIEHVLPQNPVNWGLVDQDVKHYVNLIGNLTLVGQPFNSEAQNFSLERKIGIFRESSVISTRELMAKIENDLSMIWNEDSIYERTRRIAEIAYDEVWTLS